MRPGQIAADILSSAARTCGNTTARTILTATAANVVNVPDTDSIRTALDGAITTLAGPYYAETDVARQDEIGQAVGIIDALQHCPTFTR